MRLQQRITVIFTPPRYFGGLDPVVMYLRPGVKNSKRGAPMKGATPRLLTLACLLVGTSAQTLTDEAKEWLGEKPLRVKVFTKVCRRELSQRQMLCK